MPYRPDRTMRVVGPDYRAEFGNWVLHVLHVREPHLLAWSSGAAAQSDESFFRTEKRNN